MPKDGMFPLSIIAMRRNTKEKEKVIVFLRYNKSATIQGRREGLCLTLGGFQVRKIRGAGGGSYYCRLAWVFE